MRVEVDIDLNNIDYEAINEQIKKKLDETDLDRIYRINSYCEDYVEEEVKNRVNKYLTDGYSYSGLSDSVKNDIKTQVTSIIRETVKEKMNKVFEQMGDEEFDKMIADILPGIIVDLIYDLIKGHISDSKYSVRTSIINEVQYKINQAIKR